MTKTSKGFLLPQTILPPDDVCMIVHIPNDAAYIRAFLGLYEQAGYWWAWERDAGKQGKNAAARWRESVERTKSDWEEMGDWCQMEFINNVYVQTACCDGMTFTLNNQIHIGQGVIDEITALPGGYIDNGYQVPSADWATYEGYQVSKCDYANQIADDLLLTCENLGTFAYGVAGLSYISLVEMFSVATVSGLLTGTIAVGATAAGGIVAVVGILVALAWFGGYMYRYFERVTDELTKGDLVCALVGAGTPEEAQSRLEETFGDAYLASLVNEDPGGDIFITYFNSIMRVLVPIQLMEGMFDLTDYVGNLPTADCAACSGVGGGDPVLADSVITWHSLEEASGTRADYMGVLPLTLNYGSPGNIAGVSGLALETKRSPAKRIYSAQTSVYTFLNNPYTVCGWAKCNVEIASGVPSYFVHMSDAGGNQNTVSFALMFDYVAGTGNQIVGQQGKNTVNTNNWVWNPAVIPVTQWAFFAQWHDPDADLFWLSINNNTPTSSSTGGYWPVGTNTRSLRLGGYADAGGQLNLDGAVDELVVFDRILTPAERTWMYNNGFGRDPVELFGI